MSRAQRKPLEFFKFFWRDFNRDTGHLTRAQRDGYLSVLCAYYDNRGPIHETAARQASGATAEEWVEERNLLAALFRVDAAGLWRHKRVDAELREEACRQSRRQKGGHQATQTRRRAAAASGRPYRSPSARAKNMPGLAEWTELRRQVFERDGYVCTYCEMPVDDPHCDHVVPVSRGGLSRLDNLTTACPSCNLSKGSKLVSEWRAER